VAMPHCELQSMMVQSRFCGALPVAGAVIAQANRVEIASSRSPRERVRNWTGFLTVFLMTGDEQLRLRFPASWVWCDSDPTCF